LNAKELVITIIRGAREVGAKSRLGDTWVYKNYGQSGQGGGGGAVVQVNKINQVKIQLHQPCSTYSLSYSNLNIFLSNHTSTAPHIFSYIKWNVNLIKWLQ
jgi:hypothetical protein